MKSTIGVITANNTPNSDNNVHPKEEAKAEEKPAIEMKQVSSFVHWGEVREYQCESAGNSDLSLSTTAKEEEEEDDDDDDESEQQQRKHSMEKEKEEEEEEEEEEEMEEEEGDEEEDNGWGWFDENDTSNQHQQEKVKKMFEPVKHVEKHEAIPPVEKEKKKKESNKANFARVSSLEVINRNQNKKKKSKTSFVTVVSSVKLDEFNSPENNRLLLLGSEQWPEKHSNNEKNAKSSLKKHFKYFNQSTHAQEKKKEEEKDGESETELNYFDLMSQCERENEGISIYKSTSFVMVKGLLLGLLLGGSSSFFLSLLTKKKNGKLNSLLSLIRVCFFFGASASSMHFMLRFNFTDKEKKPFWWSGKYFHYYAATFVSPYFFLLPEEDSRSFLSLFFVSRLVEAGFNGFLHFFPVVIRSAISQWFFAFVNGQITYSWMYERECLSLPLLSLLDSLSLLQPRLLVESIFRFISADWFSWLALFSARSHSLLMKCFFYVGFLLSTVSLNLVSLSFLTKVLKRETALNGYWAGVLSGLIAIQFVAKQKSKMDLSFFLFSHSLFSIGKILKKRNIFPEKTFLADYFLYLSSLSLLIKCFINERKSRIPKEEEYEEEEEEERQLGNNEQNYEDEEDEYQFKFRISESVKKMFKFCIIP